MRGYLRSEYDLQTKLNDARAAFAEAWISGSDIRSFTDRTECAAVEIDVGQAEIRAIEGIDDFRSELQ